MTNPIDDRKVTNQIAYIKSSLEDVVTQFERDKAEFAERVAQNPVYAIEVYGEAMIVSQTNADIAHELLRDWGFAFGDDPEAAANVFGGEAPATDLDKVIALLEAAQASVTEQVMRGEFYPRSTSAFGNMVNAAKAKAQAETCNGYKGLGFLLDAARSLKRSLEKQAQLATIDRYEVEGLTAERSDDATWVIAGETRPRIKVLKKAGCSWNRSLKAWTFEGAILPEQVRDLFAAA